MRQHLPLVCVVSADWTSCPGLAFVLTTVAVESPDQNGTRMPVQ